MRCVKDTLLVFGVDPKQGINGKVGGILLLHTWTQQMTYHPHIHCIVSAGGLKTNGKWQHSKSKGDFLFHVNALSGLFRGKLLAAIHQLYKSGNLSMTEQMHSDYKYIKNKLYKKEWIVYAKKDFGDPDQVLEYLGRYSHRISISNYQILNISKTHVTFRYLDRKAKKSETKTIKGEAFLRLFPEHILPKGFVKIRHIGFLCSRTKKQDLAKARASLRAPPPMPKVKLTTREFIKMTTGKAPYLSQCCGVGEMVIFAMMPAIRGSPTRAPLRFMAKDRKVNIS